MRGINSAQAEELREAISNVVRTFKVAEGSSEAGDTKLNPADVQALLFIHGNKGCIANDVSSFLGVVPTTTSAIIDRLVRRGFITRSRTEENRRIVQLSLTESGIRTVDAVIAEQNRHCEQMLEKLGPDERPHFVAMMKKISSAVS